MTTKLAAAFLFTEATVPLFGTAYCWHDHLIFAGFAWLTIAAVLIAAGFHIWRST